MFLEVIIRSYAGGEDVLPKWGVNTGWDGQTTLELEFSEQTTREFGGLAGVTIIPKRRVVQDQQEDTAGGTWGLHEAVRKAEGR